jgi:hypothetical protein
VGETSGGTTGETTGGTSDSTSAGSSEAPVGGGRPAAAVGSGGAAGESAASTGKVRFDPATRDASDVGLGEVLKYRIRLLVEGGPVDLSGTKLVSSCDCLGADFLKGPGPEGALVEVTIDAFELEDIDGSITLEDGDRKVLAEHEVRIVITHRSFVQPRVIYLDPPYNQEFTITIGHAFTLEEAAPEFLPDSPEYDETVVDIVDLDERSDLREDHHVLRMDWVFQRLEGAGSPQDGEEIILKLVAPEASLTVPVRIRPKD